MKKGIKRFWLCLLVFLLAACSSQSEEKSSMNMDQASSNESGSIAMGEKANDSSQTSNAVENKSSDEIRMVIYKANLRMRVENYEAAHRELEEKAKKYGGFMIGSNSFRNNNAQMSGSITLRIPQENFQSFLQDAEGVSDEVLERNVNGQDVTEEYVDLNSRLRSKRAVEERLLAFMKNAQKTEDLLKISNDLAKVQEEIEQVVGRMKYLENQSALSTITIDLFENNIIVPNLEDDELNTWEKTKKQFISSINLLLAVFSGIIVFTIGNLPILVLVAIIFGVLFFSLRKRKVKQPSSQPENKGKEV